tara:strand:- start:2456 stop:3658 length:1203 start_codon:yes stop_codon:yes gene_type:complete
MAKAKNLHLEHLEDQIILQGIDGGRGSIIFLRELRDMLKGNASGRVNMTVKWDGAPAIFCGPHPETKEFFVAKKSLFNKTPLYYTSEQEIKDAPELSGDLESKFLDSFKYFSKLGMKEILQGDLMFTSDKKKVTIDGEKFITFQPNTILYMVQEDSKIGKEINNAKIGIVFHTTYTGSTIEDLSASFGAKLPNGNNDIWMDDATYKDVTGYGSMTAKETLALTQSLTNTGKQFHKIKRKDLNKFMQLQQLLKSKGAVGASYMTYTNALIRGGKFKPNGQEYINFVTDHWRDKVVAKLKTEKNRKIKEEIGMQIESELRALRGFIDALTLFQKHLVEGKQLIITALNRVKSVGTFKKTDKGFETVNPEGYVAIDRNGGAVKLVDRMEFAYNNFTAQKNWDK